MFDVIMFRRLDPPEIEIERSWIHTGVHQEAYLTCIVHAEPGATVYCFFFIVQTINSNEVIYNGPLMVKGSLVS